MTPRMLQVLLHGLLVAGIASIAATARAQNAIESKPDFTSIYQRKVDAVAGGQMPQLFTGSASIAPNYGFPWIVSLGGKNNARQNGHFCGAVVVDPSWVVTAAHCVVTAIRTVDGFTVAAADPEKLQLLTGTNVLSRGGSVRQISRIVLHPEFRIVKQQIPTNDIALLKIADAPNLTPLPMASAEQAEIMLADGESVRIFGWGTALFGPNNPVSNTLLYTFVDVVGRSRCNDKAIFEGTISDSMFCAGLGYSDACQGDSGGPAVGYANGVPYLVGLVSWGVGCVNRSFPGVYTNVSKFNGWIHAIINNRY